MIDIRPKTFATRFAKRLTRWLPRRRHAPAVSGVVKLGVIGLGGVANWKLKEIATCPLARLVAVCDVRPEAVEQVRRSYPVPHGLTDYRDLLALDDVDAVMISTPNALHCPIALAAFETGKHVLCEKPLALDAREAELMFDAARATQRRAMVHFPYRLSAEAQFARAAIGQGLLGDPYHLSLVYAQGGWYAENGSLENRPGVGGWRTSRSLSGTGVLSDLGSHALDLARFWLGEADGVAATLAHLGAVTDADAIDDAASYTVRYSSGALGTFVNSRCYTGRRQHFVAELYGSRGSLCYRPGRLDWFDRPLGRWIEVAVPDEFARNITHEFCRAVLTGEPTAPDFEDGLRVQELLDAIVASSRSGRSVALGTSTDGCVDTEDSNDECLMTND